jgi:NAD dependent epimerase/dehydratase family enzyme
VWASRVNTTQSLAQAIIKAPVKPKVFISISGVGKTVSSVIYQSPTMWEEL